MLPLPSQLQLPVPMQMPLAAEHTNDTLNTGEKYVACCCTVNLAAQLRKSVQNCSTARCCILHCVLAPACWPAMLPLCKVPRTSMLSASPACDAELGCLLTEHRNRIEVPEQSDHGVLHQHTGLLGFCHDW